MSGMGMMSGGDRGMMGRGMMRGPGMGGMEMMRGGALWAISGSSMTGDSPDDMPPMLTLARGRTIRLTFRNETAWWHPMHLHGHSFKVLARNGAPVPHEVWSDTVLVAPREVVEVAFVADNPGDWMLHCHVMDHQTAGLMTGLRVARIHHSPRRPRMNRLTRRQLGAVLAAAALPLPALAASTRAVLFKNPQCDCCEGHAEYLRQQGFDVAVRPTNNLDQMSRLAGVPEHLRGCHLIQVDGYVVEGHVQASMIRKLLAERPDIAAITLPGMPSGTPGMPGPKLEPLKVYAIAKSGGAPTVYDVQ